MEFRLLGPLEVVEDEVAVRVGGLRQRTLLGVLLLHRGRVVPLERLVDAGWEADPPASAREQVRNGVWALRRALGDEAGRVVVTEDAGYRLDTGRHLVDADRFEEGVRAGRAAAAAGDLALGSAALRAALELWRGPVLAGIRSRLVREAAAGVAERRPGWPSGGSGRSRNGWRWIWPWAGTPRSWVSSPIWPASTRGGHGCSGS